MFNLESGKVYTFGETEDGKLGQGDEPAEPKLPQEVEDIEGSVTWVACGGTQTLAVTGNSNCFHFAKLLLFNPNVVVYHKCICFSNMHLA